MFVLSFVELLRTTREPVADRADTPGARGDHPCPGYLPG